MINHGKNLLDSPSIKPNEVDNSITEYRIDIDHYNKTGEIKKLKEGEIVPSKDQFLAGKKLREEITTLEQFSAVGSYQQVARQYGVSVATAHGLKLHLQASCGRKKEMSGAEMEEAKAKVALMRKEVTTTEQFNAIGSCNDVAKKYGIGKTAANKWSLELRKMKDLPTPAEIEKFFTDSESNALPQVGNDKITPPEEREAPLETSNDQGGSILPDEGKLSPESAKSETENVSESEYRCFGMYRDGHNVTDCHKCRDKEVCKVIANNPLEETKDDLQGLVEPEPAWNVNLSDEALDRIIKEIKKEPSDQELWACITEDIRILRKHAFERVDTELAVRLLDLVGGEN